MDEDFSTDLFVEYFAERWTNFVVNNDFFKTTYRLMDMTLVLLFDHRGKLSILSPLINAFVPSIIILTLTTIQFFYGMIGMKGWARGNLALIVLQLFSIINSTLALLLLYQIEFYIYDLRILRWIWWPISGIYLIFYALLAIQEIDFVYVKGMSSDSDHRAYNILNAAMVGYAVAWLFPTAFSSLMICLKEPFMNPIAWSK
jgi:hypothetical protein